MPEISNVKLAVVAIILVLFMAVFSVLPTDTDTVSDLSNVGSLIFSDNGDVLVSGTGNCYNYTLPANTYSQIVVDARGVVSSLPTSEVNMTLFINAVNVESVGASNGLLSGTFNVPMSLEYGQAQTTSVLVQLNATNVTGSPILLCKSFYVYGIV